MAERELFIHAVGARCPMGLSSLEVVTAAQAGKLEVRGTDFRDAHGHWVGMAHARFLPAHLTGAERLGRLALPALREALEGLEGELPVAIGMADSGRPDVGRDAEMTVLSILETEARVDPDRLEVFRAGHASFALALARAVRWVEDGAPLAVAGAVDGFYHPQAVQWLDSELRLHGEGTEDGVIPSEGAAFVVVGPARPAAAGAAPLARLAFVGTRDEESVDGEVLAEAMTALVQEGLARADFSRRGLLVNDLDEFHRVWEWSRVANRCQPVFERLPFLRVPDRYGDVGAATGAMAVAHVCRAWSINAPLEGPALVALHSDGKERGVVVLEEVGT